MNESQIEQMQLGDATQRGVVPAYNTGEVVYQETEYLQSLVPFDRIGDVAASLSRIEDAVNKRITELESALATLMDEYQCQNGFDTHYYAAAEVLASRFER